MRRAALIATLAAAAPAEALAQSEIMGALAAGEGTVTGRILQMAAVLTVMAVAPALLVIATSFTRFLIAFSFLRAGLGLQGAPANIVLVSLALFMTFHVMGPTFEKAWIDGGKPLLEKKITEEQAFQRIVAPFKEFMKANVREKDIKLFEDLAQRKDRSAVAEGDVELRVLVPAFMISELRRGFEIGFLILLPFLVIDLIVATLVMSMGMMMVSPSVFALPFKVLFFVLIDGWNLLVSGLVRSFA